MSYDNWLQSGAYDNEDEEIYIENRVPELMRTEDYDPALVHHLAEAISEASKDDQEIIKDYIEQSDWAKLGQKLYVMSYNYMEHFAEGKAQAEMCNGL
jgi:hypothetical protein